MPIRKNDLPARPSPLRNAVTRVMISAEEKKLLTNAARKHVLPVATYVRHVAIRHAKGEEKD